MSDTDRYGLLFELSEDAVVEIELVGHTPVVRAVNPAFVDVFGYDRGEIVGESLNEFIVPDDHASEAASFDARTARGEVNWATVTRQTASGVREFLYRGVPFERDGRSHGLAIYTDVTDRRRRERHHEVLHRVLRHNLRNDLTQILAETDRLLAATDETAVRDHVERVRDVVANLEELSRAAGRVEDVLGGEGVAAGPVDLADVLQGLVARYRREWPGSLEWEIPATCTVTADHRLDTALDALLENAVEHGLQGPGTVVCVTLARTDSEAVVTVADDGPGIPEYERSAVFDDQPISQLSHGSGLGLWLAKWIVEGYGGRLTYDRRGGETRVGARLPLA